MKVYRNILIMAVGVALVALMADGQTVWTGSGVDNNWSNTNNWSTGLVPTSGDVTQFGSGGFGVVTVDVPASVDYIQFQDVTNTYVIGDHSSTITFSGSSENMINNNSEGAQTLNANLVVSGSGGTSRIKGSVLHASASVGLHGDINSGNTLLLGGSVEITGAITAPKLTFDGGTFTIANTTDNVIAGSDNIDMLYTSGTLIVNTADNVVFYDQANLQINSAAIDITFNGANVIGDITDFILGGAAGGTITFNANETIDKLRTRNENGELTIVLGESVSNLSFGDLSGMPVTDFESDLIFTDFRSSVIRIGESSNSLTSAQFALISAYDQEGNLVTDLAIDENGFLIGTAVPEPATIGMLVVAAGVIGAIRRMTSR